MLNSNESVVDSGIERNLKGAEFNLLDTECAKELNQYLEI